MLHNHIICNSFSTLSHMVSLRFTSLIWAPSCMFSQLIILPKMWQHTGRHSIVLWNFLFFNSTINIYLKLHLKLDLVKCNAIQNEYIANIHICCNEMSKTNWVDLLLALAKNVQFIRSLLSTTAEIHTNQPQKLNVSVFHFIVSLGQKLITDRRVNTFTYILVNVTRFYAFSSQKQPCVIFCRQ